MGFSKRYKKHQKGGVLRTGIDVNSIASFNPATMPGLVFWFQTGAASIQETPVSEYAVKQLPLIRISLMDSYSSNMTQPIITELKSALPDKPNGLVRLEAVETMSTMFPTLYTPAGGEPPGIDLSSFKEGPDADTQTVTLISREPIDLPEKYTIMLDADGVSVKYNSILDRILVTAAAVAGPSTYTTDAAGKTVRVPTALLRELLVFDRELAPEEKQKVEGYLAYRGNTQYMLPPDHPYAPDLSADPVLTAPLESLNGVFTTLTAAAERLKTDYATYSAKVGPDALAPEYQAILNRVTERITTITTLRRLLSKGVLLTRAKVRGMDYTLEDVFGVINAGGLYPTPISEAQLKKEVDDSNAALVAAKEFLPKLATADQKVAEKVFAADEQKVDAARAEAETEERLRDVEVQTRRREVVRAQLQIRAELDRLGNTLLNPHVEAFRAELDTTREAFQFQEKLRRDRLREVETRLQPLRLSFGDGTWVAEFREFMDTEKTAEGNYRHPTLQTLKEVWGTIQAAAEAGDIGYLTTQLGRITAESIALLDAWAPRRSLALFRRLYVAHVRQAFERAEQWMRLLMDRLKTVEEAADQLAADLNTLRRLKEVTPFRPTFLMASFLPLEPIYFARLSPADASLLNGYTHIRTDAAGVPHAELNAAGDLDVQFMFPDLMKDLARNPAADGQAFSYASGYLDPKTKVPVPQVLNLVRIQADSILPRLPPSRIPPLRPLAPPPSELSRDLVNCVVQVAADGPQAPIALPKYAVPAEAFYCIQNTGSLPLYVRNPGAVEDTIDLVGPGEVGVYMYGEGTSLSSTPGFAYGHQVWQEGRLPYDTLRNCPRAAFGVHVTDLKTTIYCIGATKGKPEALLDASGFFVPVLASPDGATYDLDDFAFSNPYGVQLLPECKLEDLIFDRLAGKGQVFQPASPAIPVVADSKTGALVLCSRPGVPAADEFGFGKFVSSPVLWNGGAAKCKGSGEDIRLAFSDASGQQSFLHPDGLSFSRLFRSQFCKPFRQADGSLAPVFTTAQEIPLVGPGGAFILLPPNAAQTPNDTFVYAEPAGEMHQAFLLSKGAPIVEGKAAQVPYRATEVIIHNMSVERKARETINRFVSGFQYSKETPKRLTAAAEAIRSLGDVVTESVRASIADTIKMVEERLQTFTEFEGMIERLQRVMKDGEVPNDIAITLSVLELKLRDKMMEIMAIVETVQKPVENYTFLLERLTAAKQFVGRMRTLGEETFKRGYDAIQRLYKIHLDRTKSISSPEIDSVTAQLKEKEVTFRAKQTALEGRLGEQPDTVSEIREWLLDLQQDAARQFTEMQTAETLVTQQLLARLVTAEADDVAAATKELETLRAQADDLHAQGKLLAGLFETRTEPSAFTDPATAGLQKGPFVHLKKPSIEGDLIPLLGRENTAVGSLAAQGPAIAPLWADMNSRPIPPATEGAGATALRGSVESARDTVAHMRSVLGSMQARLAVPFEVYTNSAKETYDSQKAAIQAALAALKGRAMELDSQRIAITTAAQSLGETLTEDEQKRLKGVQDQIEATARKLTVESLQPEILRTQPILEGQQTNPFAVQAILKGLQDLQRSGDTYAKEMEGHVAAFKEFRQTLADRLVKVFEEQRRTLKEDYDGFLATATAERAAVAEAHRSELDALMATSPTDVPSALKAIGDVGRLRAAALG